MYECLNLVTRAGRPAGWRPDSARFSRWPESTSMRQRRPAAAAGRPGVGPGKLTLAMAITRAHNGADVTRGSLVVRRALEEHPFERRSDASHRHRQCVDWPLRFVMRAGRTLGAKPREYFVAGDGFNLPLSRSS